MHEHQFVINSASSCPLCLGDLMCLKPAHARHMACGAESFFPSAIPMSYKYLKLGFCSIFMRRESGIK